MLDEKRLGKVVNNAAICSCTMCGNPRRHFGYRTVQELSFYQDKLYL